MECVYRSLRKKQNKKRESNGEQQLMPLKMRRSSLTQFNVKRAFFFISFHYTNSNIHTDNREYVIKSELELDLNKRRQNGWPSENRNRNGIKIGNEIGRKNWLETKNGDVVQICWSR